MGSGITAETGSAAADLASGNIGAGAEPEEAGRRRGAVVLPLELEVALAGYERALRAAPLAEGTRSKYLSRVRGYLGCEVTRPLAVPRAVRDGAADAYQRAARQPGVGQPPRWGPIAADLRFMAHQLLAIRTAHGRVPETGAAGAALVAAIGALLAEIAAYHESRQCMAQASAARAAVALLHSPPGSRRPPTAPGSSSQRTHRREIGHSRQAGSGGLRSGDLLLPG